MTLKPSKNGAKMTVAGNCYPAVGLILVALAACGTGAVQRPPVSTPDAEKAIEAAMSRYVTATNQGDIEALAALYADDAVLLPPDHGPVEGRNAIEEFWRQGTDQGLAITTLRVEVNGDLGYLIGRYTLPPTPQEPADSGKYLMCLRRQPDGTWKVTADIWNSSVPQDEHRTGEEGQSPRWRVS